MFGLEKEPKDPFLFDLEEDMKKDPAKVKVMFKEIEERIGKLKNMLRQGAEVEDFDEFGTLLHGYTALKKVLTRMMESK